jgi:hypothetical protein
MILMFEKANKMQTSLLQEFFQVRIMTGNLLKYCLWLDNDCQREFLSSLEILILWIFDNQKNCELNPLYFYILIKMLISKKIFFSYEILLIFFSKGWHFVNYCRLKWNTRDKKNEFFGKKSLMKTCLSFFFSWHKINFEFQA